MAQELLRSPREDKKQYEEFRDAEFFVGILSLPMLLALNTSTFTIPSGTLIDSYNLSNHPYGSARPPLYGLRLDGLFNGQSNQIVTFSFDPADAPQVGMMLDVYDTNGLGNLALFFHGKADGGIDPGNTGVWKNPELFDVEMTYTNGNLGTIITESNGFYEMSAASEAIIPVGTIQATDGSPGPFGLVGQANKGGLVFKTALDHRGFSGLSGYGWITHSMGDEHIKASDWLFTAKQVPEPATLTVLGVGLLGLGAMARRRAAA